MEVEVYKNVVERATKGFPKFLANGTCNTEKMKFIITSWHGFDLAIVH